MFKNVVYLKINMAESYNSNGKASVPSNFPPPARLARKQYSDVGMLQLLNRPEAMAKFTGYHHYTYNKNLHLHLPPNGQIKTMTKLQLTTHFQQQWWKLEVYLFIYSLIQCLLNLVMPEINKGKFLTVQIWLLSRVLFEAGCGGACRNRSTQELDDLTTTKLDCSAWV